LNGNAHVAAPSLAKKIANMMVTCCHDSQMLAHFSQMPLLWRHNFDPDTFFCVRICRHPPNFLLLPEVHTENSSVSSDMRVMVGVAKRYLVSDNAKKIRLSHDENNTSAKIGGREDEKTERMKKNLHTNVAKQATLLGTIFFWRPKFQFLPRDFGTVL
jgi:hypothetical protein